jgi:hypothetical protein
MGCEGSRLEACQVASRHAGLRVLAEHTVTTVGNYAPVSVFPKLCFPPWVNVFRRDALAEEPNDQSLIVVYLSSEQT